MRILIRYYLLFTGLFLGSKVLGQADISLSTHWYNRASYNPAAIARTDYMYLFSNIRMQWLGVNGAPRIYNIQGSEYIHSYRSALGLSVISDQVGATRVLNPMVMYAYRISGGGSQALSLGISGGVFSRDVNGSLFEAETTNDPSINYTNERTNRPDANVGLEYQCSRFVAGVSSTHLFSIFKPTNLYLNTNHRYMYFVYKNTSPEFFNYNLGMQVVNRHNLTVIEGNVFVRFKRQTGLLNGPKEIFDIGLTYRTSHEMTLLFGMNVYNNIRVGYAFDQSFNQGYSRNSTHEIVLEYRIPCKASTTKYSCGYDGTWYH